MVEDHTFRLDLYHRLNAVELNIPPLRERRDDILPLATFFLNHFNEQNHTNKYLTASVLHLFANYSWPGNVRELQHVIEGAVALCPNDAITLDQLPMEFHILGQKALLTSASHADGLTLKQAVEQLETQMIETALQSSSSAAEAAEKLGIDASTLSKKRKRYGL